MKADLLRKVIDDFTGSSRSATKYTKAFDKLLKDCGGIERGESVFSNATGAHFYIDAF